MLFAIQVALTDSLRHLGLQISVVLGHSVGEVAAAWASGALSLNQAVQVIHERSVHQERVRGKGLMVAVMQPAAEARKILAEGSFQGVEVSAVNSHRSVTLSGPENGIKSFVAVAKGHGWLHKLLDIEYPFHNKLIDPVERDLVMALDQLAPRAGRDGIAFISTVTGKEGGGERLDARYWWNNVREPVHFERAVKCAVNQGIRLFLEVGSQPVLKGYLREITSDLPNSCTLLASLSSDDATDHDPVRAVFARALASGVSVRQERVFGVDEKNDMKLPLYPWQNKSYKSVPTREAIELLAPLTAPHPLLGQQLHGDSYVWLSHLDTARLPYLQDHKVDGKVILPGAGFAEMALAAARQWLNTDRVELRDMDIENALRLGEEGAREVRTRLSVKNGTVVIDSRVRHNDDDWLKHAECRVSAIPGDLVPKEVAPKLRQGPPLPNIARLYELCERHGLQFGPSFQRMIRCDELGEGELEVELAERLTLLDPVDGESSAYVLHPLDLDACFHGLNVLYDRLESEAGADKLAFIPVRFGVLRVYLAQVPVRSARIHILRSNARGGQCDFELFGANGELVATLQDARFRAAALVQRPVLERLSYSITHEILPYAEHQGETSAPDFDKIISFANAKVSEPGRRQEVERLCEQRQSLELAARRSAYDILRAICDKNGDLDMETLFSLPLSDAGNIANLDSSLDVGALAEIERDTMDLRLAMVSNLLAIAEQSGMAKEREGRWHLLEEHELPTQEQGFYARGEGLRELLKEDPRWIADIVLLNRAARWQSEFLGGRAQIDPSRRQAHHIYSGSLLEQMRGSSPVAGRHIDEVACLASQIIENWPRGKALRVVELGVGGGELTRKILPLISARHGRLVALDSNKTALARLNMSLGQCASFETVALDENLEAFGEAGPFDLLISANHLSFLPSPEALVPRLS